MDVNALEALKLEALKLSIEHWTRLASGETRVGEQYGPYDCALCIRFWKAHNDDVLCAGCPVFEKTGKSGCRGTPHASIEAAESAYADEHGDSEEFKDSPEFMAIAELELRFLKSLLPCPKCGSSEISTLHRQGDFALPECDYKRCDECEHQWDHT